jgi:hypothetical protein
VNRPGLYPEFVVFSLLFPAVQLCPAQNTGDERAAAILSEKCFSCHGAAKVAGLDLRQRAGALAGGARGPAVVPGSADRSILYQAVSGKAAFRMPQGGAPLTAAEIQTVREWIDNGAGWPSGTAQTPDKAESTWWAFRRPQRSQLPVVRDTSWVRNEIDAFILKKLEDSRLTPAAPAGKRTLIRRAYLDLHGLPPSPDEVEQFVNDASPDAYDKLIDRLLASPRYGERWGRHWLDAVRYADTGGFETDIYFPNAWRYRDYVIGSFNADKPFDRFVQEQVAGDELWPDDLELHGSFDIPAEKLDHLNARIATGMYTIGPVYHEAALNGEQLRYEWLSDVVDTTGSAFLGLTIQCARCHDHKFDPISQRDYHRLMAVFSGSEPRDIPVTHKMNLFGFYSGYPNLVRVEAYKGAIQRIDHAVRERVTEQIKARFGPDVIAAFSVAKEKRTAAQQRVAAPLEEALTNAGLRENAAGKEFDPPYTPQERDDRERLIYELGKVALKAQFTYPAATVLAHSDVRYPVHMTNRGDWRSKGEEVTPGLPGVFGSDAAFGPQKRKVLAQWLARKDNPLTARVMVNRIWQGHFGQGIVRSANDFGRQGELPSHPELLDWLAVEFMERGWSVKSIHRLLMLSNTYRMSSEFDQRNASIDAQNRYLWRMNRQRLDAETLRDAVLAVAGTLNLKEGGPAVVPRLTDEEKQGMWAPSQWPESLDPAEQNRRSVYLYVKRSFPFPMFTTFDMPDTSLSCGRRDVTTVAPQALALLNSSFMLNEASAFAGRLQKQAAKGASAWVDAAWRLAFSRPPTPAEAAQANRMLLAGHADPQSLRKLCLTLLNTNEFVYVD